MPNERQGLTDEQRLRLAEYRSAFTFESSDKRVAAEQYANGLSSSRQRPMKLRNRSIKAQKQWRTSHQERSVLRYTTGG